MWGNAHDVAPWFSGRTNTGGRVRLAPVVGTSSPAFRRGSSSSAAPPNDCITSRLPLLQTVCPFTVWQLTAPEPAQFRLPLTWVQRSVPANAGRLTSSAAAMARLRGIAAWRRSRGKRRSALVADLVEDTL